ncbi:Smg-4/UPF3 family-domain-containing protein [Sordaria brevicollis]|uniref:Smg-4/UPF3 family-domain-containing protein n=1 Tax=Sordaria brevicollis TaxID=83679 RepID=A0AAE0P392_SORBR|nr:Smg-4/UPF3 family-domain-containing protein [Sordaria brevicollis]
MMAAPQLLLRKPNGTAAGQATHEAQNAPKTKSQPEGEKVVVRRLPPLLTEEEFFKIIGDEWKVGHGKVDWFSYWPGKSSQHPSRPSRPSRAYLHVIKKDDLLVLSQVVQNGAWEDAKESYNDPVLILPPTVELSIHKKIPSDKKRLDNRQGTIDQEPEFMAFLESLANPEAHKNTDAAGETNAEETPTKPEKVTTTPLVEYLKEKKAQRAKEAALARSAKQHARQESQGGKTKAATATITLEELKKRAREAKGERADKASERPRDNVKILTKRGGASSATADAAKAANTVASQIQENARSSSKNDAQTKAAQSSSQSATHSTPSGDATSELPKNRRAGIAAAARILQRDLGLSPGNAHRKARQEAAKAEADAKASAAANAAASASREAASREKKEKETAPAPSNAERSATPANAADSSAAASPSGSGRGRESASGRTRGRRGRGGTTEEGAKSKGADGGKETRATEVAAPQPPIKPTMILKKRDSTQAAPPSAPSAPSTPIVAQAPATLAPQNSTTSKQPSAEGRQRGRGRGGEPKEAAKASGSTSNTPSALAPAGPTQAFIKHAHPTQGVTDSALREALEAFGPIKSMDVRKKGIAYVDFANPESLKKAIAASPLPIARASVTILERKSDAEKKEGGKDKEKETAVPEVVAASAPVEKEKAAAPEKEKEKEKAPEKEKEREKREDGERRGGRGRGRGRGRGDGGGDKDKDKEKGDKAEKGDRGGNAKGDTAAGGAKEAVPQGGTGSDRPVSAPKTERGNAGSASASARPASAQGKGEKDSKDNEKGEGEKKGENRRGRRRGGRGRGGGGDKDKENNKDGGGGRGEKKAEGGGGGGSQAAPAA